MPIDARPKKTIAIILAGAVAKGAFEAGVLKVLASANVRVARIVAASAGALNGVAYAAAIRAGRERDGATELVDLWANHADWRDVFHLRVGRLVPFRGFSDQDKLLKLLTKHVKPAHAVAPINLRIIVSPLRGVVGRIGSAPATTHEKMLSFDGPAFDDEASLASVFEAAVASASFPGAFVPFEFAGLGPCIDGGAVNNTPMKYALDGEVGQSVDAVVVVSPTVELESSAPSDEDGLGLVGRVADLLINERLFRDLHEAEHVNSALRALDALGLDDTTLARVKAALGWQTARVVDVIRIRPTDTLPGSAFSGFHRPGERDEYIRVGIQRAEHVLGSLGWL